MSMIQCDLCKSALPAPSLFCGRCGRAIKSVAAATDISSGNLQLPTSRDTAASGISAWNVSTNSYPMQGKQTLSDHDMSIIYGDEEREEIAQQPTRPLNSDTDADFLPILGGAIRPVQGNIPIVSGTPQPDGVPSVQGTQLTAQTPDFSHRTHGTQPSTSPQHATQSQDISSQSTHHLHTSHRKRQAAGKFIRAGLVTITAVTLIVAGIIGAGFTILSPALSLSGSTNVVWWGQCIQLNGSHFIPRSIVVLTLDGTQPLYYASCKPAIQASSNTNTNTAAALAMLVSQISQIDASKNTLVVGANGTFDVPIKVSSNWPAGHHTIRATEKLSQRSAVLNFSVQQSGPTSIPPTSTPTPPTSTPIPPTSTPTPPTSTPTPSPTPTPPTPTPTPCVSVTPGTLSFTAVVANGNPPAQTVTVSNCASAAGKWTASPNANWLAVNPMGGTLDGGATQQVQIAVSLGSLGVGTYTGSIVFRLGSSQSTVNVTFTLQAPCVSVSHGKFSITAVVANGNPPAQTVTVSKVTVSNCGSAAGKWTASPNANWLAVNPTGGTLDGGATQQVQIAVSLGSLGVGTYTGSIVFKLGSSQSTVNVTLTVVQAPMLSVQPTSINVYSSGCVCHVTLTNTGDVQQGNLYWSASSSGVAGITFTPPSGILAPGASVQVTVNVPSNDCSRSATLTFVGPANTVTVNWNCTIIY